MAMKEHLQKHHSINVKAMRGGGKTNEEMKKLGRGMAKVMNQRKSVRKVHKTGI